MSSKQDLIEIKEVISQCNELIKQQSQGWAKIVEEIKKVNSSAPSSYIKMQKEVADSIKKIDELETKYQVTVQKGQALQTKVNNERVKELELQRKREQAIDKYTASEAKLQAQLEKSQNTYNRVQQKVNETTQAYNNLSAKKQLGINLSDKEQRTLALLEARLNKYNGILKTVDANVGKYQRNVGNYASGWNGLSNSINQITREMPAFAVSMNTGFLALSNNIPILFDEIERTRNEVARLRADGKPTESVLTRLAGSFFSLQTAMSIGVTLLTLYGGKLISFTQDLLKVNKALDTTEATKKAFDEALTSGSVQSVVKDLADLRQKVDLAKDGFINKEKVLKEYNEGLGKTIGQANDLNEVELLLANNAEKIVKATLFKTAANYALEESAKATVEAERSRLKQLDEFSNAFLDANVSQARSQAQYESQQDNIKRNREKRREEEVKSFEDTAKKQEEIANNLMNKAKKEAEGFNLDSFFGLDDGKKEDLNKALDEVLRYRYEEQKSALELQMARAKDLNDMTDYYRAKSDLIFLDNEYNINSAKLQIKNKENLNHKLEALENNLKIAIDALRKEEDDSINERHNKRIQQERDYWDKIIDLAKKARKNEFDLTDLDNQILLAQAENEKESFDIREKQLSDWWQYQLDTTIEGSNERLKAEKEYQLKSIQLEKDKQARIEALQDNTKKILKETALNVLGGLGGYSLAQFFNGEFEAIWKGAETTAEKVAITMKAIGEISMAVMGQISAMQQANFEAQLSRLNTEKEVALKFAGDSTTGREAIEKQYEAKRKEIQKRQAIAEKKMAIMQIAMNTAVGITSALASLPPNVPLSIAIGVIGAIQAGIVASQPIPEFWTGTDNAPEGLALTQERGAEMITDKNGRIKTLGNDKGAQLTYLNKGDKVLNASDTTDKINEMLMGTGISPIVKVENKGLTKDEMLDVMNKTLARQPKQTTKFDEKGVTLFIEKENSRTIKRGNNARI